MDTYAPIKSNHEIEVVKIYAPSTRFLIDLQERLRKLNIPIHHTLPGADTPEPFIVISGLSDTDAPSAKFGASIDDTTFQVDVYLSTRIGRVQAEETRKRTKQLIGRQRNVTSELLIDDSIGRECYHIPFRISELIY